MEAALWVLLPAFTAVGGALLSFLLMQAHSQVAVARERETIASLKAQLNSLERLAEEKARVAEEEARRRALEEFLGELRVEERHYIKETKSLFMSRKAMVLQERLFFRNIPLSDWITRELPVEEETDLEQLAQACSVFARKPEPLNGKSASSRAVSEPGRTLLGSQPSSAP